MPRGPNGEKRPADVVGCAVTVAKIATGEIEEDLPAHRDIKVNGGQGQGRQHDPGGALGVGADSGAGALGLVVAHHYYGERQFRRD